MTRISDIDSEQRNEIIGNLVKRGAPMNAHYKTWLLIIDYKTLKCNSGIRRFIKNMIIEVYIWFFR